MFTALRPELAELTRLLHQWHVDFVAGWWDDDALSRHQEDRLRATVEYVRERSPFYREHLRGFADEPVERLPFTTKDDLRRAGFDLPARPVSDAWVFYETTGTTGAVVPCPRDNVDSLHNNTVLTVYYDAVFRRFGGNQVIGVCGPSELHATGDTFGDVCRNLGLAVAKMWPHSPVVGFDRAVEVLRALPVTGLFCTPGMALALVRAVRAAGLDPRRDLAVDVLMLTGELASPSLLANIGGLWAAEAHNALYASQEASVLGAVCADGTLRTAPLINHYEVVDPATARLVRPDARGVRHGELVVTNLYQGAKPLVRYRTGDLVRMYPARRGEVVPAPRLEVLGRTRDRIRLNGHVVTGYDLEDLLLDGVTGFLDYQVVLEHVAGEDRITLVLRDGPAPGDPALRRVADRCRDELSTGLEVVAGDPGAITGTGAMVSWKAARVVDRRESGVGDETRAARLIAARRTS
ncbi:phenylacetate--CoA ligase family protein [Actinosynnema sp. NPDC023794]